MSVACKFKPICGWTDINCFFGHFRGTVTRELMKCNSYLNKAFDLSF